MARSTLWLPWDFGSNTSAAGTAFKVVIDGQYLASVGAEFKGTILAIFGFFTINQSTPSNALERFSAGIIVGDKGIAVSALPDVENDISSRWFWHIGGYIGGPGADTTGLADVMMPFMFPIQGRSKRKVGFQDEIIMVAKTDGVAKLAASGRMLLLEA